MISATTRTFSRSLNSAVPRPALSGFSNLAAAVRVPVAGPSNNFAKCRTYANASSPAKAEVTAGPAISQTNSQYGLPENDATC